MSISNAFLKLWMFYSQIAGVLFISGGMAYAVMAMIGGGGPVWESKNLRVYTPVVRVGERVEFVQDLTANESCPGEVVSVMTSRHTDSGPPATVTFRRPVRRAGISTQNATAFVQLPSSVTPGKWEFVHGVDSKCLNRSRFDETARFEVTVTP